MLYTIQETSAGVNCFLLLTDYLLPLSIKVKLSPSITRQFIKGEKIMAPQICQEETEVHGRPHIPSAHCPCWYVNPSSSNPQPSLYTDCSILASTVSINQKIRY